MYGLEVRRALSVVKVATGVLGMSSVDTAPQRLEATNVHRPGLRMRLLGRAWQFWILYERAVSVSQRKVTGGSARRSQVAGPRMRRSPDLVAAEA